LNRTIDTNYYFEKILENQAKEIKEKKYSRNKVDVIIPIYNSYEYVVRCVNSVLKNSNNCRIILADDASTDKKIGIFLDQLHSTKNKNIDLIILRNQKNLGYIKTINHAYDYVKNHFVSLNSDTEVTQGWLDRLFSPIFENENQIASVTPFSNSSTSTSFPHSAQNNPLFKGLDHTIIDKYFMQFGLPDCLEIAVGNGFCLGINKKVSDEIGFFDEIYGKGYYEEGDWGMRAFKKGYKNVLAPNLFVFHHSGTTFEKEETRFLVKKNRKIVKQRFPDYKKITRGFILEDKLGPLRDLYCIIIDIFTSNEKKLTLVLDPRISSEFENFSSQISKEFKNNSNMMFIKYNSQDENLSLNYHGFVTRALMLHNTNPDNILQKIVSFFPFDQILINQGNDKIHQFNKVRKDELKNFFKINLLEVE